MPPSSRKGSMHGPALKPAHNQVEHGTACENKNSQGADVVRRKIRRGKMLIDALT